MQNIKYISMKAVLIQTSQDTMHMQYMGNVPWILPRSTRLPEQLFCHPSGLTAVWYILHTKVEQLHSDFVNIWEKKKLENVM